ncbi:TPA: DUF1837 domain-containing protein [Mannheimia haemolytica]|nr:DUF1837 domain-containing protein [Mannheimia haemolytica]
MSFSFHHMKWLIDTGNQLKTQDGKEVKVLEFQHEYNDEILSEWAKHFRNQYCKDEQIDSLRSGMGLSRKEYLNQIKFPDKSIHPGPSIRAGDFAEILAADYLEYQLRHWVPRTRYSHKTIRNESEKGSDTIGFLFFTDDISKGSPQDTLTIIESKAKYTGQHNNKLQTAVEHSNKDVIRKAETLNAIKQRFLDKEDYTNSKRIERFQNEADNPYIQQFGAIAHLDNNNYADDVITSVNASEHSYSNELFLIVIKGKEMMKLVHELYKRAADEA